MAILAKPTAGRFDAKMVAEAEALGRAAARIRPVGRRPREAQTGAHGRRRAGPGSAFWQYRAYDPGESIRNIDWRRSAQGRQCHRTRAGMGSGPDAGYLGGYLPLHGFPASAPDPTAKRRAADMLALAAASAWLENAERVYACSTTLGLRMPPGLVKLAALSPPSPALPHQTRDAAGQEGPSAQGTGPAPRLRAAGRGFPRTL